MCKKWMHLVALEALDRQDTSHAISARGWVDGCWGKVDQHSVFPHFQGKGVLYVFGRIKRSVTHNCRAINKPVSLW